jgi:hypothetical protein
MPNSRNNEFTNLVLGLEMLAVDSFSSFCYAFRRLAKSSKDFSDIVVPTTSVATAVSFKYLDIGFVAIKLFAALGAPALFFL